MERRIWAARHDPIVQSSGFPSSTLPPIPRRPALMRKRDHADPFRLDPIHERVRKILHAPEPEPSIGRGSQTRHAGEESYGTVYRRFEALGGDSSSLAQVPPDSIDQFLLCRRRENVSHAFWSCAAINARTLANTSSPGIGVVRPASMSATRRSISASHSGCSGMVGSTLASSVSISSARSSGVSFRASAVTDSRVKDMFDLVEMLIPV
ncbi:hypothetical protein ebA3285 [Aromatoleum aromaticum EbN1]|uniref:Uncharacterized protein n=1 Tax=Aromatoleum aromaticum (strain DSM 19018 / LMG 30748 / EbN1) TaxID=76114 RepID=Q5P3Y9_AROAE|nr:hypothetical protein ebA3285 [Aromatoleum aromaticum EbN1]